MVPVLGIRYSVSRYWVLGSSVARYSVFGSSVSRYSCDGQVLMAYAAHVVMIVVRYAVYPPSTPARQEGGGVRCRCLM